MTGQVGHTRAPGPSGHARAPGPSGLAAAAVPAIAVLLALVLLVAVAMAALRSDTASAETVVAEGAGVTAELADGSTRALAVGDEVPVGATARAGEDGVVLRTRDRDVLLSPYGALTVVDGERQVLRDGFVMVDARRGPAVAVETPAAAVTTPGGAVSRIEPGPLLRVGAFVGDPVQVRATGRRAATEVARYSQVQVPVGGLPTRVTPLALTGDAFERRLAGDLLADDRALADVGRTLDAAGAQGPAVLAALRTALPAVAEADVDVVAAAAGSGRAAGSAPSPAAAPAATPAAPAAPRSEPALAFLLAAAGDGVEPGDPELAERYTSARALRADGGSWGVVARLVEAPVPAVGELLDRLLAPVVLLAGSAPEPGDLISLLVPPAASSTPPVAPDPGAPAEGGAPGAPPTAPPPPPPSSPPPPGPVPPPPDDPVETLEEVVETVIGLLPDPPVPLPVPLPTPSPTPSVLEPLEPVLEPLDPLTR